MLIFIGALVLARVAAAFLYIALLPLGAALYLATQLLKTPNIEWLLERLAEFIKTPILYPFRSEGDRARWREGEWAPWSRSDWYKDRWGRWTLKDGK